MKEYGELFADDPAWATRAHDFSSRVRDVSEVVAELGTPRAPRHPLPAPGSRTTTRVIWRTRQAFGGEPRDLSVRSIPGLEIVELSEPEICCGSAGIYNLVQPEAAADLGARKARQVIDASIRI